MADENIHTDHHFILLTLVKRYRANKYSLIIKFYYHCTILKVTQSIRLLCREQACSYNQLYSSQYC